MTARFTNYIVLLAFCCLFSPSLFAGQLTPGRAEAFYQALLQPDSTLNRFVLAAELKKSSRLNIHYPGVPNKLLIQYDLDDALRRLLQRGRLKHESRIEALEDGYSRLDILVPAKEYRQSFYFLADSLVSPAHYHTRNWQSRDTRYFRIHSANPRLFSPYAEKQLDAFADSLLQFLQAGAERRALLEREKIEYLLCSGPGEIEQITGFAARGISELGMDRVISSFPAHTHEAAHLLINFVLQDPPLYVHPFFQEGFASAVGGRGGRSIELIAGMGAFLQASKFIDVAELQTVQDFRAIDPSLSYPVSGLYNRYLLERWPLERYLKRYRAAGSPRPLSGFMRALPDTALAADDFAAYATGYTGEPAVFFPEEMPQGAALLSGHWGQIWQQEEAYVFELRGGIQLIPPQPQRDFQSSEFRAIFPDVRYAGQQYFLEITENEVKLFNFYNANLEAFYSTGLTLQPRPVRQEDGMHRFAVLRKAFAMPVELMQIVQ